MSMHVLASASQNLKARSRPTAEATQTPAAAASVDRMKHERPSAPTNIIPSTRRVVREQPSHQPELVLAGIEGGPTQRARSADSSSLWADVVADVWHAIASSNAGCRR